MRENYHFELGKTYVATLPDGSKTDFIVVGGPDPYKIRVGDKIMDHTELLNVCTEIHEKEAEKQKQKQEQEKEKKKKEKKEKKEKEEEEEEEKKEEKEEEEEKEDE